MADKVYEPEVIDDAPFPQDTNESYEIDQSSSGREGDKTYGQQTVDDQKMPTKRIAVELISAVLNTKSRKITGEMEFTPTGAFQIGDYKDGESGDVRVSRNGIVARDVSGNTTFALDGETGDAAFAGQLRAGSTIISDSIINERSSNGNGRTVYLVDGIPTILIGDPS